VAPAGPPAPWKRPAPPAVGLGVPGPPAGIGTRGKELTSESTDMMPKTTQATPPRKTSRATRYQIRPGLIFAGGAASGAAPGPPSLGGVQGVFIVPPLIEQTSQIRCAAGAVIPDL